MCEGQEAVSGLARPVTIFVATAPEEIERCFPVMSQLRPHLEPGRFVETVQRQQSGAYQLAALEAQGRVVAVAGFRFGENLAWGRFCYVDDLVTDEAERSNGYGALLFDWLVQRAEEVGCAQFHLDSGVQRFDAHRFYLGKRMSITSHHFGLNLDRAAK